MTLYLLKVHLQTFLSIPITQKCQILSCDTLVANERYVSRGCHVLLHSTERNTLKIDSFFGMSLPSQNCSTGLPIKYCRCHAHLSSSTDHHGNDSLAIRGGGGGEKKSTGRMFKKFQANPSTGWNVHRRAHTTIMSQVHSTLSSKTSRQEGKVTEDNSHDPLKLTKLNDQNCSMSNEQEPSTPLLSTPKGIQNYLEASLRTSARGRLGGTQMLVTKSPILTFASRSTQQSGFPSVRDCI